jgi:hypothetical protein
LNTEIVNRWISERLVLYPELNFQWVKDRKSKLGDYRYYPRNKKHLITLNDNMQPMATWVVFLHEFAHYFVKKNYDKASPHGKEWKFEFRKLLEQEILKKSWLDEEVQFLKKFWRKPTARMTNTEISGVKSGTSVKEIGHHPFTIKSKGPFLIVHKRRTRFLIKELSTNKEYLIHQDAEVQKHH